MTTEPAREQNQSARTAFITGVSGQDGSYLTEHLISSGWTVHGMVRPGTMCAMLPQPP
jgi:GDP-D-mannose dehydratase